MEIDWDNILNQLTEFAATWGIKVVGVLIALMAGWVFAGWIQRLVNKKLADRFDTSVVRFFASLARYGIITLVAIGCLGVFGIQTASFAAVLAAAGLAIGLAFQGTLSNFASGIMILIFRPFKVGDLINAGGETGVAQEIDLFTTELKTPDNLRVIVPNSKIFGDTIINYTHHGIRRISIPVGVDYGADSDKVRSVLEEAVPNVEGALEDPAPQVFLESLGDSAVNWQLRVWTDNDDNWDVYQSAVRVTKLALDEAGISIPFPQQDLHLDTDLVAAIGKKDAA